MGAARVEYADASLGENAPGAFLAPLAHEIERDGAASLERQAGIAERGRRLVVELGVARRAIRLAVRELRLGALVEAVGDSAGSGKAAVVVAEEVGRRSERKLPVADDDAGDCGERLLDARMVAERPRADDLEERVAAQVDEEHLREDAPRRAVEDDGVGGVAVFVELVVVAVEPVDVVLALPGHRQLGGLSVAGVVLPGAEEHAAGVLFPGRVLLVRAVGAAHAEVAPEPGDEQVRAPVLRQRADASASRHPPERVVVVAVRAVGVRRVDERPRPAAHRTGDGERLRRVGADEGEAAQTGAGGDGALASRRRGKLERKRAGGVPGGAPREIERGRHGRGADPRRRNRQIGVEVLGVRVAKRRAAEDDAGLGERAGVDAQVGETSRRPLLARGKRRARAAPGRIRRTDGDGNQPLAPDLDRLELLNGIGRGGKSRRD